MLKPRVLLAQARAPVIHANITTVQGLTSFITAASAIIPGLADLLPSFYLTHRSEGISLDLSLAVIGPGLDIRRTLSRFGLRELCKWLYGR